MDRAHNQLRRIPQTSQSQNGPTPAQRLVAQARQEALVTNGGQVQTRPTPSGLGGDLSSALRRYQVSRPQQDSQTQLQQQPQQQVESEIRPVQHFHTGRYGYMGRDAHPRAQTPPIEETPIHATQHITTGGRGYTGAYRTEASLTPPAQSSHRLHSSDVAIPKAEKKEQKSGLAEESETKTSSTSKAYKHSGRARAIATTVGVLFILAALAFIVGGILSAITPGLISFITPAMLLGTGVAMMAIGIGLIAGIHRKIEVVTSSDPNRYFQTYDNTMFENDEHRADSPSAQELTPDPLSPFPPRGVQDRRLSFEPETAYDFSPRPRVNPYATPAESFIYSPEQKRSRLTRQDKETRHHRRPHTPESPIWTTQTHPQKPGTSSQPQLRTRESMLWEDPTNGLLPPPPEEQAPSLRVPIFFPRAQVPSPVPSPVPAPQAPVPKYNSRREMVGQREQAGKNETNSGSGSGQAQQAPNTRLRLPIPALQGPDDDEKQNVLSELKRVLKDKQNK